MFNDVCPRAGWSQGCFHAKKYISYISISSNSNGTTIFKLMICIAFYLRSTLGGDIANKVHVGDAHANTTPRHSRTAVGAILLLIRLKTQDRRTQSVKKRKHHKQIPMHTPWLGHTKKNRANSILPSPSGFSAPPLLESFVLYCPSWFPGVKSEAKQPCSLGPLTGHWELFTWYGMMNTARNPPKLMDTPVFLHVFCRASLIVFCSITSILRYSADIFIHLSYIKYDKIQIPMHMKPNKTVHDSAPWLLHFVQLARRWWMGASGSAEQLEPSCWWHPHIKPGSVYERHTVTHGYTSYAGIPFTSSSFAKKIGESFVLLWSRWLPDAFIFWLVVANLPERKLGLCERMDGLMDDIQKKLTI